MAYKHTADELIAAAAKGLKSAEEQVALTDRQVGEAKEALTEAERRHTAAIDNVTAYEKHVAEKGINLHLPLFSS